MIHDLISWSGFFIVWIDTFLRYFKFDYGNRFNSAFFCALNAFQIANSGILVDFQPIDLLIAILFYVAPFQHFYFLFDGFRTELDYFLSLLGLLHNEYSDGKSNHAQIMRKMESKFGAKINFLEIAQVIIDNYIYGIVIIFLLQFLVLYLAGYFGI